MKLEGACHCRAVTFSCRSAAPYPYQRCYCSICRKTAGAGGYAINIMAAADSLRVTGKRHLKVYRARLGDRADADAHGRSPGQRHFCGECGSPLWLFDPRWPELVHPFASAIDTPLPVPPERVHMMLDFAPAWCEPDLRPQDARFGGYPEESIEEWHRRHGLWQRS